MLVSSLAVGITGITRSRGTAGVAGSSGEASLDEVRGRVHVDGRQVPEELLAVLGVLELQNGVAGLGGGELDGDATAVGVGAPFLGVLAAAGGHGLHVAGLGGGAPEVDVLVEVVDDLHVAGAGIVTSDDGLGERSSGGSEDAGDQDVGEEHFGRCVVLVKDCAMIVKV